jgi:lactoylglutathione lyase
MIRVKDKIASLNFYQQIMGKTSTPSLPQENSLILTSPLLTGMNLLYTLEIPEAGFDLCYLGYPSATKSDPSSCEIPFHEGLIGLTWNYGTEKDPELSYHSGNTDPKGFGHFCISVDDLEAACARFEEKGVQWKKRRTEGRMKHLAFFLDPDGYWIEVCFHFPGSPSLSVFLILFLFFTSSREKNENTLAN